MPAARPPRRAAGYGGSCYLNNAAVAAQSLRQAGAARVAIVDIDAHHGNGTQSIFYDRADVLYASVHVDPGGRLVPALPGLRQRGRERGRSGFHLQPPAGAWQWR